MGDLVRLLIGASEKAANIARVIRREEELFQLLIEEKTSIKKRDCLVRDFKTLADVLIQETVRHDVSSQFPDIARNIFGEESNQFTNSAGESIIITVGQNVEGTRRMLEKVLGDDHFRAAEILAAEVHGSIEPDPENDICNGEEDRIHKIPRDLIGSYSNLGIWIDPIDATSEYIKGDIQTLTESEAGDEERVFSNGGLQCVTVLIGVFQLDTGLSILGVVNQPFWKFSAEECRWRGRHFWGVAIGSVKLTNVRALPLRKTSNPVIILSDSEDEPIKEKLREDFQLIRAPGAGYKLLCVITGLADFYILSKSSTHLWDTCAPHAILQALGGGIDSFDGRRERLDEACPITYGPGDPWRKERNYANWGGLFVFREQNQFVPLLLKALWESVN